MSERCWRSKLQSHSPSQWCRWWDQHGWGTISCLFHDWLQRGTYWCWYKWNNTNCNQSQRGDQRLRARQRSSSRRRMRRTSCRQWWCCQWWLSLWSQSNYPKRLQWAWRESISTNQSQAIHSRYIQDQWGTMRIARKLRTMKQSKGQKPIKKWDFCMRRLPYLSGLIEDIAGEVSIDISTGI